MIGLSPKQRILVRYITEYQVLHQRSPSVREMRDYLGVSSDHGILKHIEALVRKGELEVQEGHGHRNILFTRAAQSMLIDKWRGVHPAS